MPYDPNISALGDSLYGSIYGAPAPNILPPSAQAGYFQARGQQAPPITSDQAADEMHRQVLAKGLGLTGTIFDTPRPLEHVRPGGGFQPGVQTITAPGAMQPPSAQSVPPPALPQPAPPGGATFVPPPASPVASDYSPPIPGVGAPTGFTSTPRTDFGVMPAMVALRGNYPGGGGIIPNAPAAASGGAGTQPAALPPGRQPLHQMGPVRPGTPPLPPRRPAGNLPGPTPIPPSRAAVLGPRPQALAPQAPRVAHVAGPAWLGALFRAGQPSPTGMSAMVNRPISDRGSEGGR